MIRATTKAAAARGSGGRVWVAAGLGVALAFSAAARAGAEGVKLRWKFKAGEALHYQMEQKTVTAMKNNGQDIKTTHTQTIDMTWKVGDVAEDGTASITQSIDRIRTKIDAAFASLEFDSKDPKEQEGPIAAAVIPALKAMVGASFQYKMNPRGELSDVKVPEGLIKKLQESNPSAGGAGMFSEEGLKNMINESALALPAEDLEKGKSWNRQTKLPPSPVGTMSFDKTYTFNGETDGVGQIGLTSKIALEPTPGNNVEIKLASQEGKGTFAFDNKAGRVTESSVSQKIEMSITVMNNQIAQSTDTTSNMKLITDKPAEKGADAKAAETSK